MIHMTRLTQAQVCQQSHLSCSYVAYPVAFLVYLLYPAAYRLTGWVPLLEVRPRVSSALNTPTVLVQVHIVHSLPNLLDNAARTEMRVLADHLFDRCRYNEQ